MEEGTTQWQMVPIQVSCGRGERGRVHSPSLFPSRAPHPLILPAGIFVDDIIEAGAIDKYFELFKPNGGGEGGERAEEGGRGERGGAGEQCEGGEDRVCVEWPFNMYFEIMRGGRGGRVRAGGEGRGSQGQP